MRPLLATRQVEKEAGEFFRVDASDDIAGRYRTCHPRAGEMEHLRDGPALMFDGNALGRTQADLQDGE